jgi:hypothetical protein
MRQHGFINNPAGLAGDQSTDRPLTTRRRKEATMATSKAKRLIALAQPLPRQAKSGLAGGPKTPPRSPKSSRTQKTGLKPEAAAMMPVKAHVYHSIAELNSGFEKVVQELQTLGGISLFRSSGLSGMREMISRMRAQANRDFARAIHERESANAAP